VGVWSRKAFKQRSEVRKPEQLDDILLQIITPRVHDHAISSLRLPRLVEIVVWEYIEMNILSVWFPDMGVELMNNMTDLQGWIRGGGKKISRIHEMSMSDVHQTNPKAMGGRNIGEHTQFPYCFRIPPCRILSGNTKRVQLIFGLSFTLCRSTRCS